MASAELFSLNVLTDLADALGRFGSRGKECLDLAEGNLRRQMAQLAERRQEAERQLRVCEIACASASEEEADEAGRALAEAKEHLSLVRRWHGRAEEACQAYRSFARQFERTVSDHIPKAQLKLRTKHDEGAAYLAVQLDGDVQPIQRAAAAPPSLTNARTQEVPKLESVVQFSLPPGFRWMSLEHISRRDDLRHDEGFSKVSEHDMRRAFGTLRRQVLPYLDSHPEANGRTFLDLDGYTTEGTPKPRQMTYDVFFGAGAIVLDGPYSDGTFSVTNGRHRIKVARDLGWSAVPARVIESG
ncbi:hypothetical protein [uncultured Thiodictyon sp.]|jgi:hypothetical protein|uniref:hypothetical protein n=1 Tax=uncultured Thiodictyon sp. TaxID=1846217 RepID=UPI0025D83F9B|nr:hypothetical protein [uncultured Thiodictyon sp.]